jgi:hypothetical protein
VILTPQGGAEGEEPDVDIGQEHPRSRQLKVGVTHQVGHLLYVEEVNVNRHEFDAAVS